MPAKTSKFERVKMSMLAKYLRESGGNVSEAAREMGISRASATSWIKKSHDLQKLLDHLRHSDEY